MKNINFEKFNMKQIKQIKLGLKNNLDVKIYANPKYNFLQMKEIRKGLEKQLNVEIYAKPELNIFQMYQMRRDLEVSKQILKDWDSI